MPTKERIRTEEQLQYEIKRLKAELAALECQRQDFDQTYPKRVAVYRIKIQELDDKTQAKIEIRQGIELLSAQEQLLKEELESLEDKCQQTREKISEIQVDKCLLKTGGQHLYEERRWQNEIEYTCQECKHRIIRYGW